MIVSIKRILLIMIFFLVFSSCINYEKNFYHISKYPPIKTITINENGRTYTIEAVSGHVIVIFKQNISPQNVFFTIKKTGGIIISQIVDMRYYLVYVGSGNESNFIHQMKSHTDVRFVFLNTASYPCADAPQTSVIDNFYISHGDNVTYALQECGLTTKIDKYNAGIKGDENGGLIQSEIDRDLYSVLKDLPDNTPLIINMSIGPSFTDPNIDYWTDKNITDTVKNNYREHYKEDLRNLAAIASQYQEKDFVIVKAAGNEGLKNLDTEILNELGGELSSEEFAVLNKHFILAGAEDRRNQKYSNTVSKGNYNFLYTTVDISDMSYNDKNLYGTSFAAPRVSCFISSTVNEHNIKAIDALKAVKDITYRNPDMVLTQRDLEREAKIIAANMPAETNTKDPGNRSQVYCQE